jgi:hypothetical protein
LPPIDTDKKYTSANELISDVAKNHGDMKYIILCNFSYQTSSEKYLHMLAAPAGLILGLIALATGAFVIFLILAVGLSIIRWMSGNGAGRQDEHCDVIAFGSEKIIVLSLIHSSDGNFSLKSAIYHEWSEMHSIKHGGWGDKLAIELPDDRYAMLGENEKGIPLKPPFSEMILPTVSSDTIFLLENLRGEAKRRQRAVSNSASA